MSSPKSPRRPADPRLLAGRVRRDAAFPRLARDVECPPHAARPLPRPAKRPPRDWQSPERWDSLD